MGNDGPRWKSAYQALKHDRINSIDRASVINLINSMRALYLLNIYNSGYSEIFPNAMAASNISTSFGSSIFSVKMFSVRNLNFKKELAEKTEDVKECVLILHPLEEDVSGFNKLTETIEEELVQKSIDEINSDQQKLAQLVKESDMDERIKQLINSQREELRPDYFNQNAGRLKQKFQKVKYRVELNKNLFVPLPSNT